MTTCTHCPKPATYAFSVPGDTTATANTCGVHMEQELDALLTTSPTACVIVDRLETGATA